MSSIILPSEGFFVAIHLVTESCDHYNMLLHFTDLDNFVEKLKGQIGDEMAHISNHFISTNIKEIDNFLSDYLGMLIDQAHAEYERKWQEENS